MPNCSACGAEPAPGDAFCQVCGTALKVAVPAATMMPPIPTVPVHEIGGDGNGHEQDQRSTVSIAAAGAADQLIGRSQPNQTYLGNRLLYEPGESFDPLSGAFLKAMLIEALIVWFASVALAIVPTLFFVIGSANGSGALRVLGGLGLLVAGPGLWIYFWFHRIPVIASEWKFLIDDQSGVADQVFTHVTWALSRRRTPVAKMKVRRLSQPRGRKRDYLELRDGIFTGFISSFAYGEDLYIGWTMWWRLSPFRWVLVFLGRLYLTLTGRGSQLHIIHRYEQAKAMREAMHSAAREGVDAAAGVVAYQGAGTIGSEVEVEVVDSLDNVPRFAAAATE
jgi:hypothetical protein